MSVKWFNVYEINPWFSTESGKKPPDGLRLVAQNNGPEDSFGTHPFC